MANLNELLIGLGYAKQVDIATPPSSPGFWRVPNWNKKPWAQQPINEDDHQEIGKGHEFATQQWRSHYDNGVYQIERPASSEILAHALGFGLGNVVLADGVYTITPIVPATNPTELELPYFQFAQQIRPGGSAVLDQVFTGCAMKGWKLSIKAGPGRASAMVTEELVSSGLYTEPSGVTIPPAITWHEMQSTTLTLQVNGVDYVTAKSFVSLDMAWDNNFRPGFFPRGTTGVLDGGYATQGRLEIGDRTASLQFVVRFKHGSSELTTLRNLTTGTAVIGLANGTSTTDTLQATWEKLGFRAAEVSDVDGIVTVAVTGTPIYDDTNGLLSAVINCSTTGICQ
jgi:hypothetical protein